MRRKARTVFISAAVGALLGFVGVAVTAAPAQAAPPSNCYANSVCVYEDVDFNHGHPYSAWETVIPVAQLYDCKAVPLRDGVATSFYNNTRFTFELWNMYGFGSQRLAGRIAPYKGYRYLNATFNDRVDIIVSPGCLTT